MIGVAENFGEAFAKARIAAGDKLPTSGHVFISVNARDEPPVAELHDYSWSWHSNWWRQLEQREFSKMLDSRWRSSTR